jgi:hypothetical protein
MSFTPESAAHLHAQLRGLDRSDVSSGSASDDDHIVLLCAADTHDVSCSCNCDAGKRQRRIDAPFAAFEAEKSLVLTAAERWRQMPARLSRIIAARSQIAE